MRNDHKLSLLLLDQRGDVVDAVLNDGRLLACILLATGSLGLGQLLQTLLLGGLVLRAVLAQKLEHRHGCVAQNALASRVIACKVTRAAVQMRNYKDP